MDEYIKRMVDEFLRWKLPADFAPDGGISHNFGHLTPTSPLWPVGTNLFTASQATDMFARCANSLIEDLARKDADCHSNGLRVETLESELARVREERDELRALLDEAQAEHERLRNAIGYALSVGQVVGGSKQLLRAAIAGEGVKG